MACDKRTCCPVRKATKAGFLVEVRVGTLQGMGHFNYSGTQKKIIAVVHRKVTFLFKKSNNHTRKLCVNSKPRVLSEVCCPKYRPMVSNRSIQKRARR